MLLLMHEKVKDGPAFTNRIVFIQDIATDHRSTIPPNLNSAECTIQGIIQRKLIRLIFTANFLYFFSHFISCF